MGSSTLSFGILIFQGKMKKFVIESEKMVNDRIKDSLVNNRYMETSDTMLFFHRMRGTCIFFVCDSTF